MTTTEARQKVVAEAQRYLGTPYFHMGMQRLAGVDCLTFLYLSFLGAGLIKPINIEYYPQDWHHHRDIERYMMGLLQFTEEVPGPPEREPLPGDVVLFRFGRVFSHGALIESWPTVLHAFLDKGVIRSSLLQDVKLMVVNEQVPGRGKPRPRRYFCLKEWVR